MSKKTWLAVLQCPGLKTPKELQAANVLPKHDRDEITSLHTPPNMVMSGKNRKSTGPKYILTIDSMNKYQWDWSTSMYFRLILTVSLKERFSSFSLAFLKAQILKIFTFFDNSHFTTLRKVLSAINNSALSTIYERICWKVDTFVKT